MNRQSTWTAMHRVSIGALTAIGLVIGLRGVAAQQQDLCGCAGATSLGAFDTSNPSSWPPGLVASQQNNRLDLQLPADGVLVFDSLVIKPRPSDTNNLNVFFVPNARNTPVTILVKGNVTLTDLTTINVSAPAPVSSGGTDGLAGGPGGFRGGDGAYPLMNSAFLTGGAGLGPLGGAPGSNAPLTAGADGQFFGNLELLPMIGGSGGGGGAAPATNQCAGGGGGGGGGAILISANGTVSVSGANSFIFADGTAGHFATNISCTASGGGAGSGGAIRIVARMITGAGFLSARGGAAGNTGRIRLEAMFNDLPTNKTIPFAGRLAVPGPPAPPINPIVNISRVGGVAPSKTTGNLGGVDDVTILAPGSVQIDVATAGVPSGTNVEVYVKPRLGGPQTTLPVTLTSCSGDGACTATVSTTLASGTYTIEARATFQTP